MPKLFFVMGMTNSGKSTMLDAAKTIPNVGTVEVGRLMRAKYPPEHFKGQDAPAHTAIEAWQMMLDGIAANQNKRAIFIDGQPRDVTQARESVKLPYPSEYLILFAPHDVRVARAIERDGSELGPYTKQLVQNGEVALGELAIPSKLKLSLSRMSNDYTSNYNVLAELASHGINPTWIFTDGPTDYRTIVEQLL